MRVGKTSLADALSKRIHAKYLPDSEENPFLEAFYDGVPGAAFQTQMYYLVRRFQQLSGAAVESTRFPIVTDYLFEKDKLFAYINLNDAELGLYDEYYRSFRDQLPAPDLVVYLKASPAVLRDRIARKNIPVEKKISDEYLDEVTRAYEHFFKHYHSSDLLVVDTSKVDFVHNKADLDELLRELTRPVQGTQFFLPLGS